MTEDGMPDEKRMPENAPLLADPWEVRTALLIKELVDHAWFSMDTVIARLVAASCDVYLDRRMGECKPEGVDIDSDIEDWKPLNDLFYRRLKDEALRYGDFRISDGRDFPDLLAAAIRGGYLWD